MRSTTPYTSTSRRDPVARRSRCAPRPTPPRRPSACVSRSAACVVRRGGRRSPTPRGTRRRAATPRPSRCGSRAHRSARGTSRAPPLVAPSRARRRRASPRGRAAFGAHRRELAGPRAAEARHRDLVDLVEGVGAVPTSDVAEARSEPAASATVTPARRASAASAAGARSGRGRVDGPSRDRADALVHATATVTTFTSRSSGIAQATASTSGSSSPGRSRTARPVRPATRRARRPGDCGARRAAPCRCRRSQRAGGRRGSRLRRGPRAGPESPEGGTFELRHPPCDRGTVDFPRTHARPPMRPATPRTSRTRRRAFTRPQCTDAPVFPDVPSPWARSPIREQRTAVSWGGNRSAPSHFPRRRRACTACELPRTVVTFGAPDHDVRLWSGFPTGGILADHGGHGAG